MRVISFIFRVLRKAVSLESSLSKALFLDGRLLKSKKDFTGKIETILMSAHLVDLDFCFGRSERPRASMPSKRSFLAIQARVLSSSFARACMNCKTYNTGLTHLPQFEI